MRTAITVETCFALHANRISKSISPSMFDFLVQFLLSLSSSGLKFWHGGGLLRAAPWIFVSVYLYFYLLLSSFIIDLYCMCYLLCYCYFHLVSFISFICYFICCFQLIFVFSSLFMFYCICMSCLLFCLFLFLHSIIVLFIVFSCHVISFLFHFYVYI